MAGLNLAFRRQFIMGSKEVKALCHWTKLRLDSVNLIIHAHPDLDVEEARGNGRSLVLMGYIFDARNPHHTNRDIVEGLVLMSSFEDLLEATHEYAGRFILVYLDRFSARLLHDAGGLRQVYYTRRPSGLWCGSQPGILAKFLDLEKSDDEALKEFCESKQFISGHKAWLGDGTVYDGVKHLMPNHYLDLVTGESHRYCPSKRLEEIPLGEAVEAGTSYLKGFLSCASDRYQLVQAVTAGWDSRVLLAASRHRRNEICYFVNKHRHLTSSSPDVRVPRQLLDRLGLEFHVIEYSDAVDEKFRAAFCENVTLNRETLLPVIYNVYLKQFPGRMIVNGDVSAITRNYFGGRKDVSGETLAALVGYRGLAYPTRECSKWLKESQFVARECNISVLDLFYWEQRVGNWGALGPAETDISVEEFSPFNCRSLLMTLLSVDRRHRDKHFNRLYHEMIKRMWDETLMEPINPSRRLLLIRVLKALRLFTAAKHLCERMARL
jgi:hypothetical protein